MGNMKVENSIRNCFCKPSESLNVYGIQVIPTTKTGQWNWMLDHGNLCLKCSIGIDRLTRPGLWILMHIKAYILIGFGCIYHIFPTSLRTFHTIVIDDRHKNRLVEIRVLTTLNKLYCIVLYCIVLYCIVLYCIVLYCIVLLIVLYVRLVS
jgi:hypothetical protein